MYLFVRVVDLGCKMRCVHYTDAVTNGDMLYCSRVQGDKHVRIRCVQCLNKVRTIVESAEIFLKVHSQDS